MYCFSYGLAGQKNTGLLIMHSEPSYFYRNVLICICLILHVLLQYYVDHIVRYFGNEFVVKLAVLLYNLGIYCFVVWLWTSSVAQVKIFAGIALSIVAVSGIGFFMERLHIDAGFFLSLLRSGLIDIPLLLFIFLSAPYLMPKKAGSR